MIHFFALFSVFVYCDSIEFSNITDVIRIKDYDYHHCTSAHYAGNPEIIHFVDKSNSKQYHWITSQSTTSEDNIDTHWTLVSWCTDFHIAKEKKHNISQYH